MAEVKNELLEEIQAQEEQNMTETDELSTGESNILIWKKPEDTEDHLDYCQHDCCNSVVTFDADKDTGDSNEVEVEGFLNELRIALFPKSKEQLKGQNIKPCGSERIRFLLRYPLMVMHKGPFINWPRVFISLSLERLGKTFRRNYHPEHVKITGDRYNPLHDVHFKSDLKTSLVQKVLMKQGIFLTSSVMERLKKDRTLHASEASGAISNVVEADPNETGQLMNSIN